MYQIYFSILDILNRFLEFGLGLLKNFWWLFLFIIVFPLFINLWLWWRQTLQKAGVQWTLLEIRPPREVKKSPKAMEQILTSIYSLRNAPANFYEKWIEGDVTRWFSLEIASFGGEIHFYVRTPVKYKNVIEANFYAHYPDIEVFQVDDYIYKMPLTTKELYEEGLEVFGSELKLGKDDAYPIRTYAQFESMREEEILDPISALLEGLGKLKKQEHLWLQFIIRPADPAWKEKGDKLISELKEKMTQGEKRGKEGEAIQMLKTPTPGEVDIIKAIERNVSKAGFDTVIRLVYFAPREIFDDTFAKRGIQSAFNQYSSMNLNFFLHNFKVRTETPRWFEYPYFNRKKRYEGKKQRILKAYQERSFPEELTIGKILNINPSNFNFYSKPFVLNTEELATLYHFPYYFVTTTPFISEIESKRVGPPTGLPIFKEEEK